MKNIVLTNGQYCIVDDEDFDLVNSKNWWYDKYGQSNTAYAKTEINGKTVRMHRFLLNVTDPKMHVDHINGNGLDNRRSNLRMSTCAQNIANQRLSIRNTSGYKGVHWHSQNKKWRSCLCVNKKKKSLGLYFSAEEAARAYDRAAVKYFGEFAKLNFP